MRVYTSLRIKALSSQKVAKHSLCKEKSVAFSQTMLLDVLVVLIINYTELPISHIHIMITYKPSLHMNETVNQASQNSSICKG